MANVLVVRFLEAELKGKDVEITLLKREVDVLKEKVEYWRNKSVANWDILETVCVGEKLYCDACKQYHPCKCDGCQPSAD